MSVADLGYLTDAQQHRRATGKPRPSLLVKADKRGQQLRREAKLRADIRGRDGHQCQCCHIPVFVQASNPLQRAEVHHIQFRSKGGVDDQKNMITVCAGCHAKIHAHEIEVRGTHALNVRFIRKGVR
jgi:5-methylcytosine-specific restriction endonuclease McrA